MTANFEAEKNKKAFTYTLIICGTLLLLFFFITWPILKVAPPAALDLIEINLGNNIEGFGDEQPLIKGEMSPDQAQAQQQKSTPADNEPTQDLQPDANAEADAAAITKPIKVTPKAIAIPNRLHVAEQPRVSKGVRSGARGLARKGVHDPRLHEQHGQCATPP